MPLQAKTTPTVVSPPTHPCPHLPPRMVTLEKRWLVSRPVLHIVMHYLPLCMKPHAIMHETHYVMQNGLCAKLRLHSSFDRPDMYRYKPWLSLQEDWCCTVTDGHGCQCSAQMAEKRLSNMALLLLIEVQLKQQSHHRAAFLRP